VASTWPVEEKTLRVFLEQFALGELPWTQHREVHPFGQQPQAHLNTIWTRIPGRVAADAKAGLAALTLQGLNIFAYTSFPVSYQGMSSLSVMPK